jgi:uroporphyrinogen decarboxylase
LVDERGFVNAQPARSTATQLLRVLRGETINPAPIWLMRQAGRYLPEYRAIRAKANSFLEFCYTPALATEATLQPIRRFGFDAAILFSDILVVPDALGQNVWFETGEGPKLEPILSREAFVKLADEIDLPRLAPVFETIERVKAELPPEVALIGFCGAPWTVASYMIAGGSRPDQAPARLLAYRDRTLVQALVDRLVEASISYLLRQIEAGVDVVQIFDSWAGVLPAAELDHWCVAPVARIVAALANRHPEIPVIGFPRGIGGRLETYATRTFVTCLGLDTMIAPEWADRILPPGLPVQGNLDPLALLAGGEALDRSVATITAALRERPHIFNLGHGIAPDTPIEHVERLVHLVRRDKP